VDLPTSVTYIALQACYPEHSWKEVKKLPQGYWKDPKHQRLFFDQLAVKLNLKKPEEWLTLNIQTVMRHSGSWFIKTVYKGSLLQGNSLTLILISTN
jgi:hypothetical protein